MMMAADGYFTFTGREAIPPGVTRVRIDESVTVIPAQAFYGHPNLEEVDFHIGVKKVEGWAFYNCPYLTRVIMRGVKVVERYAFMGCKALAIVECGKLERIVEGAFGGCKSLESINLQSAKIIERYAFDGCEALAKIKFSDKLESIREGAFADCTSLERITIPLKDGMIAHDSTFAGCKKLTNIDLVEEAVLRDTIAALLLEEWKNDMNEEINSINQILSNAPAGNVSRHDAGEKARAIRMWIRSVLDKIIQYKAQHQQILEEAAATLKLSLPQDIVIKNVLPFLELQSYTFEVRDHEDEDEEDDRE